MCKLLILPTLVNFESIFLGSVAEAPIFFDLETKDLKANLDLLENRMKR